MSLTTTDLSEIRTIIREEIKPLQNEIQAIHNDIKEIYDEIKEIKGRLSKLEIAVMPDKDFAKLSTEAKLLRLNSELLTAAKEIGLTLPR